MKVWFVIIIMNKETKYIARLETQKGYRVFLNQYINKLLAKIGKRYKLFRDISKNLH